MEVLVLAALWAGWMVFWTASQWSRKKLTPVLLIQEVLESALMGLWFGTMMTFGWRRALRMPLVTITVGSFAASLIISRAFGRRRAP